MGLDWNKQEAARCTDCLRSQDRTSSLISAWTIQKDPCQKRDRLRGERRGRGQGGGKKEGKGCQFFPSSSPEDFSRLAQNSYAWALGDFMRGWPWLRALTPHRRLPCGCARSCHHPVIPLTLMTSLMFLSGSPLVTAGVSPPLPHLPCSSLFRWCLYIPGSSIPHQVGQ